MTLQDMFFVETSKGHDNFRMGQVRAEVGPGFYLLDFKINPAAQKEDITVPMEIASLGDMSEQCPGCGERLWDFFETEKARDAWIEKVIDLKAEAEAAEATPAQGEAPAKVTSILKPKLLH
jgi:hypothetical protein